MIEGLESKLRQRGTMVLEPSAGKGDLAEVIARHGKDNIHCIEIEPELQAILRDKDFKVVHGDFLSYNPDAIFDFIIMNPPFDAGAKHLKKAIDIAEGAEIRCLLNAETLNNPYSKDREVLGNILEDLEAEIVPLGQCFKTAERRSGVETVMVIVKTKCSKFEFNFSTRTEGERHYRIEDIENSQIAHRNVFKSLEASFDACKRVAIDLIRNYQELKSYSSNLIGEYSNVRELINKAFDNGGSVQQYNALISGLRKHAWGNVFTKTKLASVVTTKVQETFYENQRTQGEMAFTAENIQLLFDDLFFNREAIMQQCIIDAFDLLTKYHKENRVHVEGWKTNDAWKVNRKVVLPYIVRECWDGQGLELNYMHSSARQLDDIEKALSFVSGKKFEDCRTISRSFHESRKQSGVKYDTEFFEFRCYKKGTMHLTFKDDYIYEQFNIIACRGKNWLKSA
jgi:predicted RNA methylase